MRHCEVRHWHIDFTKHIDHTLQIACCPGTAGSNALCGGRQEGGSQHADAGTVTEHAQQQQRDRLPAASLVAAQRQATTQAYRPKHGARPLSISPDPRSFHPTSLTGTSNCLLLTSRPPVNLDSPLPVL